MSDPQYDFGILKRDKKDGTNEDPTEQVTQLFAYIMSICIVQGITPQQIAKVSVNFKDLALYATDLISEIIKLKK